MDSSLAPYEQQRLKNIERNSAVLGTLGLEGGVRKSMRNTKTDAMKPVKRSKAKTKLEKKSSEVTRKSKRSRKAVNYNEEKIVGEEEEKAPHHRSALKPQHKLAAGKKATYKNPPARPPSDIGILNKTEPVPTRNKFGELVFPDYPDFKPNLTPKEIMQLGSFGGTYWRPIQSGVTGEKYSGQWKEFPMDWFEGLDVGKQVTSRKYDPAVNKFGVKCGGDLDMWESSGWIAAVDPYGWYQWYCRFYLGRRCADDARQIGRARGVIGERGRFRCQLMNKVHAAGAAHDDARVSPNPNVPYIDAFSLKQMDAGGNASLILSDVKEIGQKRRLEEDDDIISKLWIPPWRKGGPLFNGYGPPPAEYDYTLVTAEVDHEGLGAFKNQPFTSKGFHFAGKLAGLPVHQMCHYTNKTLTDNNQVWNDCSSDSMKHLYMDVLGKSKPPKEGRCLDMGPYGNCMDVWINTPGGTGTNLLWNFLRGHGVAAGEREFPWGKRLVHLAQPLKRCDLPFVKKAIMLMGDPCTALFSIFRRNLQKMNAEKANTRPLTKDERQAITTLDTYLRGQKDVLRFTDHFDRWVQPQRCQGYPIFYVKFGPALWEHLPHFLRFLGVPEKFVPEMVKDIPLERKRKTPHYGENHPNTKKCRAMYKDLYERYDSFPDAAIIQM